MQILAQYSSEASEGAGLIALLLLIAIPVIFGAWSANAAERKGIPRSTGWLLGILLGLLGRIIVGVMRDRTLAPRPPSMPSRPDVR